MLNRTYDIAWKPRTITLYADVIDAETGKKVSAKIENTYLDFIIQWVWKNGDIESNSYTASVPPGRGNCPEIRIRDPRGDARDQDKLVSRNLTDFQAANTWIPADMMAEILDTVTSCYAAKLAKAIAKWEEKRAKKAAA